MQVSKRLIVLGIFGLLALPLMGVASAQNLLANPGFETGDLTGWTLAGVSGSSNVTIVSGQQDNNSSQPGTYSGYMDNQAQAIGLLLKQSTAAGSATAGTVHYAFDLKLGAQANSGVFFVEIFAEVAGGGVIGGSGVLGNFAPTGWTYFSGTFSAPAGTDFLTFQFVAVTGAVGGALSQMYVDNAFLGQVPPPVATEDMSMGSIKALYR